MSNSGDDSSGGSPKIITQKELKDIVTRESSDRLSAELRVGTKTLTETQIENLSRADLIANVCALRTCAKQHVSVKQLIPHFVPVGSVATRGAATSVQEVEAPASADNQLALMMQMFRHMEERRVELEEKRMKEAAEKEERCLKEAAEKEERRIKETTDMENKRLET